MIRRLIGDNNATGLYNCALLQVAQPFTCLLCKMVLSGPVQPLKSCGSASHTQLMILLQLRGMRYFSNMLRPVVFEDAEDPIGEQLLDYTPCGPCLLTCCMMFD